VGFLYGPVEIGKFDPVAVGFQAPVGAQMEEKSRHDNLYGSEMRMDARRIVKSFGALTYVRACAARQG
jgi:hypothetical protein